MSKTLKRFLVILIVVFGVVLAIQRKEKAFEVPDNMEIWTGFNPMEIYDKKMKNFRENWYKDSFQMRATLATLYNKNVFCLEHHQNLPDHYDTVASGCDCGKGWASLEASYYKCTWKITIEDGIVYQQRKGGSKEELTGEVADFTKGLAYIFANMKDTDGSDFTNPSTWHMHDDNNVNLNNYYGEQKPGQPEVWSYLYSFNGKFHTSDWFSNIDFSANGMMSCDEDLLNKALSIGIGNFPNINITKAEFYILENEEGQTILIVGRAISEEVSQNLNFKFTKKDENGNTLQGATVNVKISGTKKHDGIKTVSSTGYLEIKDMELKDSNGTIVIAIQESAAPSGYTLDTTKYSYNIKYNSSEKKWYIDSSNTKTNGANQLFNGTLSGSILTTSLINVR